MPLDDTERNPQPLPAPPALRKADFGGLPRAFFDRRAPSTTAETWRIATDLFFAAGQQVPVGSLPCDLAALADLGKTTVRRLRHRFDGVAALLRLMLCSDGRLWVIIAEDNRGRRRKLRPPPDPELRPAGRLAAVELAQHRQQGGRHV